MRFKLFHLFVVVLVCSFSAIAQTVIEAESRVIIQGKTASATLAIKSDENVGSVPAFVELLDTSGIVRAHSEVDRPNIYSGEQSLQFQLPIGDIVLSQAEDIAWYRLRYHIGDASGIIALSQLIPDLFELRIIASDNLMSGMTYRVRIRAINPFAGHPTAGVKIETGVELGLSGDGEQKLNLNNTSETDADGFAVVDFTIPPETKLDSDGKIKVLGLKNGIVREAEEDLNALKEDLQFLIMTDKPIYQPEQTLNVRGILMKGGEAKTVLSGIEIEFRISDQEDTVLYREKVRSSEFGIASISWTIPSSVKLGDYQIEIRDENGEVIGGDRVKISRYDLPNFVVEAKPDKPYYLPGETEADVEIKAEYLFGRPVAKGKVRVVEEKNREWNWAAQKYDLNEGQIREGETDANGRFIAKIDLKETLDDLDDENWSKHKDIKLAAYFTDSTTNKTEQRRFDIRLTREPIHVYFVRDSYKLNPALPIIAYVSTFYADGTPAECDIEIKASVEDKDKFKTVGHLRTNSYGAGKLKMMRPKIGDTDDDLDLGIIAKDKYGRRGTSKEEISFDTDEPAIQITTDRTIYKPGDAVTATIKSTEKSGTVYIDVVNGWSVIDSRFVQINDGRAALQIPYSETFKGELKVAAFMEADEDKLVQASRGIIFPSRQGINVDAEFDKSVYKPNEEATVKFGVVDAVGHAIESALGIVVFDKAIEERARTDADFGGMWRGFSGWLGYGRSFGGINVKDLNEIDLTKPITSELQLVAEVILHDAYYYPKIFRSRSYNTEASSIFGAMVSKQLAPVEAALKTTFERQNYLHPIDETSLHNILNGYKIDVTKMRDPWGMPYKAVFSVDKMRDLVTILSSGPDKQFDTRDDFTAISTGFEYFTLLGKAIDTVVKNFHTRTGGFIRDEKTLFAEFGIREFLDRFGRPYRIVFEGDGRFLKIRVRSGGLDGKFENYDWQGDDFYVWTNQIDYFETIEKKMADVQRSVKSIPMNEPQFRETLKGGGIDFDTIRDGYGNLLYVTVEQTSRYWDRVAVETVQIHGEAKRTDRTVLTPATQQIVKFTIRSNGKDGKQNTWDDFTLTQIVHVVSEQSKDDPKPVPVFKPAAYYGSTGSITGVVKDANDAVVPNVIVTATNDATHVSSSSTANENGSFLIANLAAGTYSVRVPATQGFNASVISNVSVVADKTTRVDIVLSIGAAASVVDVSASDSNSVDTTRTSVENSISSQQAELLPKGLNFSSILHSRPQSAGTTQENSTPRLREYFPETLFWQPEVLTDKNGRTEVKFRMADNITTWKMYTIASTKKGKIGVAEKEITAFQPFFVDLDPPKFLTAGDEIFLPTQVRNYTDKRQSVDVTMARTDWFSFLGVEKLRVDVDSGKSQNAVFGFKATTAIKDGKQRVTAIAQTDSDAIERTVTVRPDGQEIVRTESKVFSGNAAFDVNFPMNALPQTQKAELNIYPNLFSHVTESVKGLLERPYGCGEQTISSTYPNLMILKFVKADSPIRQKAKKYLQAGYERLLGYQVADGGFTYWGGKDTSDVALTAYAIRFLNDAKSQIAVDDEVIKKAEEWLIKQQRVDGSWTKKYYWENSEDAGRTKLTTTYVARSLAVLKSNDKAALTKGLDYLKARNAEIDEPYALALFGLASLDAGDIEAAGMIAKRLEKMAIDEGGSIYWKLETNTPFYGWGTAGRIETTALVLQLLIRVPDTSVQADAARKDLIAKGTLFLLKNKDRYGVWYSTQTTINVLDAFLAALADKKEMENQTIQIFVNGESVQSILIPADKIDPATVDLTGKLNAVANRVEVRGSDNSPLMSQIVSTHYIDWRDSIVSNRTVNQSRALSMEYTCDKSTAAIMEEVTCSVQAERIGSRGYGMLLAEIGTPPGADVSRESLENAVESDWSISRYDVLPDRIIVYMWSKAGGTKFNFKFKPRYGINAQTPASVVYDYYNPEAHTTVAPLRLLAK